MVSIASHLKMPHRSTMWNKELTTGKPLAVGVQYISNAHGTLTGCLPNLLVKVQADHTHAAKWACKAQLSNVA